MKTLHRAAIMVLSVGTSSARADGYSPTTLFTCIPDEQSSCVSPAPRPAPFTIPNGAVLHRYVTTICRGNSLFQPALDSGGR